MRTPTARAGTAAWPRRTQPVPRPRRPARASRIDFGKLADVLGVHKKQLHLATEEALERDYAEFELGAAPPFGGSRPDPVVVDRHAAERDSLVVEAGTHTESIRLKTADLVGLTEARVADICAA